MGTPHARRLGFGPSRRRRGRPVALAALGLVVLLGAAGCGSDGHSGPAAANGSKSTDTLPPVTKAQLAEASRLVNIGELKQAPPAPVVECIARTVVQNPFLDQAANDIAQIPNKDLRQTVMYAFLQCGYNYILDSYMRFAPANLSKTELACIRSKFTDLDENRFAEVIVEDPDAGYTGPLVIHACATGSKKNPLLNPDGSLVGMGGS